MRVPHWVVPALVVLSAGAGVGGARLFAVPSVVVDLGPEKAGAAPRTTVFVVDGVKCVDTAERAAGQLEGMAGVVRFVAYASRNRVEIAFDPSATGVSQLREALEGPVLDRLSGEYHFHVYKVVEIDGIDVAKP